MDDDEDIYRIDVDTSDAVDKVEDLKRQITELKKLLSSKTVNPSLDIDVTSATQELKDLQHELQTTIAAYKTARTSIGGTPLGQNIGSTTSSGNAAERSRLAAKKREQQAKALIAQVQKTADAEEEAAEALEHEQMVLDKMKDPSVKKMYVQGALTAVGDQRGAPASSTYLDPKRNKALKDWQDRHLKAGQLQDAPGQVLTGPRVRRVIDVMSGAHAAQSSKAGLKEWVNAKDQIQDVLTREWGAQFGEIWKNMGYNPQTGEIDTALKAQQKAVIRKWRDTYHPDAGKISALWDLKGLMNAQVQHESITPSMVKNTIPKVADWDPSITEKIRPTASIDAVTGAVQKSLTAPKGTPRKKGDPNTFIQVPPKLMKKTLDLNRLTHQLQPIPMWDESNISTASPHDLMQLQRNGLTQDSPYTDKYLAAMVEASKGVQSGPGLTHRQYKELQDYKGLGTELGGENPIHHKPVDWSKFVPEGGMGTGKKSDTIAYLAESSHVNTIISNAKKVQEAIQDVEEDTAEDIAPPVIHPDAAAPEGHPGHSVQNTFGSFTNLKAGMGGPIPTDLPKVALEMAAAQSKRFEAIQQRIAENKAAPASMQVPGTGTTSTFMGKSSVEGAAGFRKYDRSGAVFTSEEAFKKHRQQQIEDAMQKQYSRIGDITGETLTASMSLRDRLAETLPPTMKIRDLLKRIPEGIKQTPEQLTQMAQSYKTKWLSRQPAQVQLANAAPALPGTPGTQKPTVLGNIKTALHNVFGEKYKATIAFYDEAEAEAARQAFEALPGHRKQVTKAVEQPSVTGGMPLYTVTSEGVLRGTNINQQRQDLQDTFRTQTSGGSVAAAKSSLQIDEQRLSIGARLQQYGKDADKLNWKLVRGQMALLGVAFSIQGAVKMVESVVQTLATQLGDLEGNFKNIGMALALGPKTGNMATLLHGMLGDSKGIVSAWKNFQYASATVNSLLEYMAYKIFSDKRVMSAIVEAIDKIAKMLQGDFINRIIDLIVLLIQNLPDIVSNVMDVAEWLMKFATLPGMGKFVADMAGFAIVAQMLMGPLAIIGSGFQALSWALDGIGALVDAGLFGKLSTGIAGLGGSAVTGGVAAAAGTGAAVEEAFAVGGVTAAGGLTATALLTGAAALLITVCVTGAIVNAVTEGEHAANRKALIEEAFNRFGPNTTAADIQQLITEHQNKADYQLSLETGSPGGTWNETTHTVDPWSPDFLAAIDKSTDNIVGKATDYTDAMNIATDKITGAADASQISIEQRAESIINGDATQETLIRSVSSNWYGNLTDLDRHTYDAAMAMQANKTAIEKMMANTTLFGGLPGKAVGGGVASGQAYIVGEKGPEVFVPSTAGSIIPNHMLGLANGSMILPPTMDTNTTLAEFANSTKVIQDSAATLDQASDVIHDAVKEQASNTKYGNEALKGILGTAATQISNIGARIMDRTVGGTTSSWDSSSGTYKENNGTTGLNLAKVEPDDTGSVHYGSSITELWNRRLTYLQLGVDNWLTKLPVSYFKDHGVPGLATGGSVVGTGIAVVHAGEKVLSADQVQDGEAAIRSVQVTNYNTVTVNNKTDEKYLEDLLGKRYYGNSG